MTATLITAIKFHSTLASGEDNAAGKVYTYAAGTTTPQATYTSAAMTTPNTNPIILDGSGRASVWLDPALSYKFVIQDSSGAATPDGTVDNIVSAVGEISNTSDVTKGDALVGVKKTGALATNQHIVNEARDFSAVADGGCVQDGTTQTAKIQALLDAVPVYGATIVIENNVKFNLKSLTFPARFTLKYRIDDDLSQAGMGFEPGSGEIVHLIATSGYPIDPSGGYVNEERLTAPLQPAHLVDARKDLTAATPYLGPGQTLNDPVRMSYNGQDEQTDRFRIVGEYFKDYSNFSGMFLHGWQSFTTLTGIGTQDYTPVPAAGSAVTGTVSGARGFFVYAEGTAVGLSACRYNSTYTITTAGTTLWTAFGAANNTVGTSFTYVAPVNATAGGFVIGKSYAIAAANETDFTLVGAADNMIGTVFTATADGNFPATPVLGTPGLALPQFGTGTCTGTRKTVIAFQTGRFEVGDALVYTSGTTPTTATAWAPVSSRFQEISQGTQNGGGWMIGDRPPGSASEALNVAGNLLMVPTRNGSTVIPRQVQMPAVLFSGNPEAASPYKLGINYDPADPLKDHAYQRLGQSRSDKGDGKQWCGEFVPVSAQINFTNTVAIGLQSVNIRKMTRVAAGRYAFEFHYPLARSDYSVQFGKDGFFMGGWDVGLVFPTTTSCEVRVYNAAAALADIPAGGFVCMTLMGGDV